MVKVHEKDTAVGEDGSLGDSVDRLPSFLGGEQQGTDAGRPGEDEPGETTDWMALARNAYEDSTRFVESSVRWQWERNIRSFQSRHPTGSKYLSDAFRHRTKLYRPKTRANIRQGEAAVAQAFFSNEDVIQVTATDQTDQRQLASADINKKLLQYRLTTSSPTVGIPWFLTLVGAYQDAQVWGVVTSKQWWEYEERTEIETTPLLDEENRPVVDAETGQPALQRTETTTVVLDRPRVDPFPPENVRIDRGADWRDPINSSPYVILLHPMYVHEVETRMEAADTKGGRPKWHKLDRGQLKAATRRQIWDSTRTQREQNREDPKESEIAIDEFTIVWIHENIIRWKGRDVVYWTAGTHHLLSDPVPIEKVYRHARYGDRPIVMGIGLIETHRIYPSAKPQLTEGLQAETNDIANLRIDNLKLGLMQRWKVKRGRNVDNRSLMRAVPGSITMVNEMEDVEMMETRDVTQSSYREQDRINADFDEVAGNFSTGSVQTSRSLNETVGGMELMAGSANQVGELDMRVFSETWAEPVLRQVIRMEQIYETNEKILSIAAQQAQLYQRYGISTLDDDLLNQDLTTKVSVGVGATSPQGRLQNFTMAGQAAREFLGEETLQAVINAEPIIKEIFGTLGYGDGMRFFKLQPGQDPMVEQLMQQIAELEETIEKREIDAQAKRDVARIGGASRVIAQIIENEGQLQIERVKGDTQAEQQGRQQDAERERQGRDSAAQGAEKQRDRLAELEKLILQGGISERQERIRAAATRANGGGNSGAR